MGKRDCPYLAVVRNILKPCEYCLIRWDLPDLTALEEYLVLCLSLLLGAANNVSGAMGLGLVFRFCGDLSCWVWD